MSRASLSPKQILALIASTPLSQEQGGRFGRIPWGGASRLKCHKYLSSYKKNSRIFEKILNPPQKILKILLKISKISKIISFYFADLARCKFRGIAALISKLECGFLLYDKYENRGHSWSGDHTDLKGPSGSWFSIWKEAMISEDKLVINKSGPPTSECRKEKGMHK